MTEDAICNCPACEIARGKWTCGANIDEIDRLKKTDSRRANMSVEIHGPFLPEHHVTVDGYRVPYIAAFPQEDGRISVVIDKRFGSEPVSPEEFERWMPLIANAMAIAAGQASFGEQAEWPFNRRMSRLGMKPRAVE